MIGYLVRRLPAAALLLLASSVVAFVLPRLAPGDPAVAIAGPDATPEVLHQIRVELGLDQPLVTQYAAWLSGLFTGDLGNSLTTRRSVAELIGGRLESTLTLAAVAGILMIVVGIALGVATAVAKGRIARVIFDVINSAMLASPPFLTGLLLIAVLGLAFPVFPISGEVPLSRDPIEALRYLALPAIALALPQAATVGRLAAASMHVTAREEFVDLARAKGLAPRRIVGHHVMRNSMAPALVTIGLRLGELLAGAIVIEAIFARHGLGSLAVTSVQTRDYPVVQVLVVAAVAVAILMQVLTDIGVAALDPRVRLGGAR